MKSRKPIAGALSVLAAGFALAAFGGGGEVNSNAAAAAASKSSGNRGLPQGSEPVNLKQADFNPDLDEDGTHARRIVDALASTLQ